MRQSIFISQFCFLRMFPAWRFRSPQCPCCICITRPRLVMIIVAFLISIVGFGIAHGGIGKNFEAEEKQPSCTYKLNNFNVRPQNFNMIQKSPITIPNCAQTPCKPAFQGSSVRNRTPPLQSAPCLSPGTDLKGASDACREHVSTCSIHKSPVGQPISKTHDIQAASLPF